MEEPKQKLTPDERKKALEDGRKRAEDERKVKATQHLAKIKSTVESQNPNAKEEDKKAMVDKILDNEKFDLKLSRARETYEKCIVEQSQRNSKGGRMISVEAVQKLIAT